MPELTWRRPRLRDKAYLAFVATQRCCVCGRQPVHVAHVRMACPARGKRHVGMGEKPDDRWCVPLCPGCHLYDTSAQHKGGEAAFWDRHGINPFDVAEKLYGEYQESLR